MLYAQWTPVEYSITYKNVSNATRPEKTTYTVDEGFALEIPSKENRVFQGWYTSLLFKEGTEISEIPAGHTGNLTLYARWKLVR